LNYTSKLHIATIYFLFYFFASQVLRKSMFRYGIC